MAFLSIEQATKLVVFLEVKLRRSCHTSLLTVCYNGYFSNCIYNASPSSVSLGDTLFPQEVRIRVPDNLLSKYNILRSHKFEMVQGFLVEKQDVKISVLSCGPTVNGKVIHRAWCHVWRSTSQVESMPWALILYISSSTHSTSELDSGTSPLIHFLCTMEQT